MDSSTRGVEGSRGVFEQRTYKYIGCSRNLDSGAIWGLVNEPEKT